MQEGLWDISMEKHVIKKLTPELEYKIFNSIRNQSEVGYFIFDLYLNSLVYVNPACERMCGKSRYELQNYESLQQHIHEEDREVIFNSLREIVVDNNPKCFQFRLNYSKSLRWLSAKIFAVRNDLGELNWIAGSVDEITPVKKFEELLYNINSKKTSILEILAHDLTRPINTIQLLTSILKKDLDGEKFKEINRYFKIIDDTCNSSIDLITELVNNELLLSAKVEIVKDRTEIVGKVKNLIEVYKWSQEEKCKTFSVISPEEKIFVEVDEVKLLQAINNLIANAVKFTKENGHISILLNKMESHLQIVVKDDGVGIPSDLQPFLFDKFTRAARTGLKGEKTVGLGMSITKTIIELHRGKIWFESEVDKGTAFYIRIPTNAC